MPNKPTGWAAVGYGLAGGFEKDREAKRKQLQQEATKNGVDAVKTGLESEKLSIENEKLKMQQRMMQNQMIARDLTAATDDLVETGNPEVFNLTMENNPYLKDKLKRVYGVNNISQVNWEDPSHKKLIKSLGLTDEMLEGFDGDDKDSFKRAYYIAHTDKGNVITSLGDFLDQTGYMQKASSIRGDNASRVLEGARKIGQKLTIEEKDFESWKEQPGNEYKTLHDYRAAGKPKTLSEVKGESAEKWLRDNPDKTYMDYESLKKTSTKMTTASLKSEYADLQVADSEGTLDDSSKIRLKVLDKLFSTDNDDKRDILETGIKITDKYTGRLFDDATDIEQKDVIDSKLYSQQSGIKPDTKANREFKDQFNTVKTGYRLVEDVNALGNEELSRGILDTGIQKIKKMVSDGTFEELSTEEQEKTLNSIKMNTKLGMFLAKYIKSISGTAVAQSEFDRLTNLFSGSTFENTQALKTGVSEFVNELDIQFKDTAQTSLLDNPSTTLDLVKRYKAMNKPTEVVVEPEVDITVEPVKYKQTATNPKTGERMGLTDSGWELIK